MLDIEIRNKEIFKKREEEKQEFLHLINSTLNNEDGKKLLNILELKFNNEIDFNNVYKNYYRDGRLDVIKYLKNCIKKINKK